jgi:DNA-directed RNA polymerase subunit M/transcription elongation factor TFIIS
MQDLVWFDKVCDRCNGRLNPQRGSEDDELSPDRLVCINCGKEFAIDMSNTGRKLSPLIEPSKLNEFIKTFIN